MDEQSADSRDIRGLESAEYCITQDADADLATLRRSTASRARRIMGTGSGILLLTRPGESVWATAPTATRFREQTT